MLNILNPRQSILVTCRHRLKSKFPTKEAESDNVMAADWHMPCSFEPMLYAIAIGKLRHSFKMIKESKVFVVNFISNKMEQAAITCGRNSGSQTDKFKLAKLEKEESATIDCPRLKDALAYLECEVITEVDAGDHVIFIGKVTRSEHVKDGKRLFHLTKNRFTTTVD